MRQSEMLLASCCFVDDVVSKWDGISEFRLCGKRATAAGLRATAVHSCQKCTVTPPIHFKPSRKGIFRRYRSQPQLCLDKFRSLFLTFSRTHILSQSWPQRPHTSLPCIALVSPFRPSCHPSYPRSLDVGGAKTGRRSPTHTFLPGYSTKYPRHCSTSTVTVIAGSWLKLVLAPQRESW